MRLFATCLGDLFQPRIVHKTRRLLEQLGYEVDQPAGWHCCGQVAYNAGRITEARRMAEHWVDAFFREPVPDFVVAPSASCVAMVRERFPDLVPRARHLVGRVLELSEFLHDVVNARGGPLSRTGFWKILRQAALKAGLGKRVYPHILRHTFATHMLSNGCNLRVLQELLGHASVSTTEVYTHLSIQHLKEVFQRYHPRA